MANVKRGNLTRPPQWWRHLRDWKRTFWKGERKAVRRDVDVQVDDHHNPPYPYAPEDEQPSPFWDRD